jgi:hypothetical protein
VKRKRKCKYNKGGEVVQSTLYGITTMKPPGIFNVY